MSQHRHPTPARKCPHCGRRLDRRRKQDIAREAHRGCAEFEEVRRKVADAVPAAEVERLEGLRQKILRNMAEGLPALFDERSSLPFHFRGSS